MPPQRSHAAFLPEDLHVESDAPEPASVDLPPGSRLSGDPELDALLLAECAAPEYGDPLPESAEAPAPPAPPATDDVAPAASPTMRAESAPPARTHWVLACERPATAGGPRVSWYWTAEGWQDESSRHLAIPYRTEQLAGRALATQEPDKLALFQGWIGGVAEPRERFDR